VTILKWILDIEGGLLWNGFIWLRIGTSGGLLFTPKVASSIPDEIIGFFS
jgi:hypothetical protein